MKTKHSEPKLIRFVENGNLDIDNNRPEREAKAFAVGRKIGYLQTPQQVLMQAAFITAL